MGNGDQENGAQLRGKQMRRMIDKPDVYEKVAANIGNAMIRIAHHAMTTGEMKPASRDDICKLLRKHFVPRCVEHNDRTSSQQK